MYPHVPMQKLKASTDVTPDVSKLSKNSIIPMNTSEYFLPGILVPLHEF